MIIVYKSALPVKVGWVKRIGILRIKYKTEAVKADWKTSFFSSYSFLRMNPWERTSSEMAVARFRAKKFKERRLKLRVKFKTPPAFKSK